MNSTFDRFGKALATAIQMIRDQSMDPTDALLKTAESCNLSAPEISFVGAQLNNSRALAHFFKTSGPARLAAFPLADSEAVISRLKAPVHVASADNDINPFLNPTRETIQSLADRVAFYLSKQAEAEECKKPKKNAMKAFLSIKKEEEEADKDKANLEKVYKQDIEKTARTCSGLLLDISTEFRRMNSNERAKYARRLVNGYDASGVAILSSVMHKAEVQDPIPNRTSSERVFPAERIYTNTTKLLDTSRRLINMQASYDLISHEAGSGFIEDFLANSAALSAATKWLPSSAAGGAVGAMDDIRQADEASKGFGDLSPATAAKWTGLRTRRSFMDAVLSDPNMRGYPLPKLTEAFNNAVQNDPSIIYSPPNLRAGMMQMLQSSVLDPFMLKQMSDAGAKRLSIFEDMRKRTQSGITEAKDYASKQAGRAVDAKAGVLKVYSDIAKQNAQDAAALNTRISGSWNNMLTNLEKAKTDYDRVKLNQMVPKQVDAFLAQLSPNEQNRLVTAGGFSDVNAMRSVFIKQAWEGKGPFVQTSALQQVEKEMQKIDKEREAKAADKQRDLEELGADTELAIKGQRADAQRDLEELGADTEASIKATQADRQRDLEELGADTEFAISAREGNRQKNLEELAADTEYAMRNDEAGQLAGKVISERLGKETPYRAEAIREVERQIGMPIQELAAESMQNNFPGSEDHDRLVDALNRVTAYEQAMNQAEDVAQVALRGSKSPAERLAMGKALTEAMVGEAMGEPAALPPQAKDAVNEAMRLYEADKISSIANVIERSNRRTHPKEMIELSSRLGQDWRGSNVREIFSGLVLTNITDPTIQEDVARSGALPTQALTGNIGRKLQSLRSDMSAIIQRGSDPNASDADIAAAQAATVLMETAHDVFTGQGPQAVGSNPLIFKKI